MQRTLVIAHYAEYHYASVQEKNFGEVVEDDDIKERSIADYCAESITKIDLHAPDGSLIAPGAEGEHSPPNSGAPAEQ